VHFRNELLITNPRVVKSVCAKGRKMLCRAIAEMIPATGHMEERERLALAGMPCFGRSQFKIPKPVLLNVQFAI